MPQLPPLAGTRLVGKVAIVTGAGSDDSFMGIGGAVARLFAAQGAAVVVFDTSAERAAVTVSAIEAQNGKAIAFIGDVTSAGDCASAVETAVSRFGRLDVVINNAAIVGHMADRFDEAVWKRALEINLLGPTLLSEAAAAAMAKGGGGSIINMSSIAAFRGMGSGTYASSKAGLIGLTIDMAYRFGRDEIRVNCIAPGHVHTPMGYSTDVNRELRRRAGPLGTEGTPFDVAWACVFLASDESRWITGVVLPVDAGTTATTAMAMHSFMTEV